MPATIQPEQMEEYRETARRRRAHRLAQLSARRERCWQVAREAARLLKEEFGARRVAAFGSILVPSHFHEHSDLDLAVWGMAEASFLKAVSRLQSIDPGISVDLVEVESAREPVRARIESEGVGL